MRKKIAAGVLALVGFVSWSAAFLLVTSSSGFEPTAAQPAVVASVNFREKPSAVAKTWPQRGAAAAVLSKPAARLSAKFDVTKAQPQVLGTQTYNVSNLSAEQALALDKPGVVGIINWMDGELSIADFDISLKDLSMIPRPDLGRHTITADWNVYGSGFVVNPDGYIATNAHVIAKDSAYDQMKQDILDHWKDVLDEELSQLSAKEQASLEQYFKDTYGTNEADATDKLAKIISDEVDKYAEANLEDNTTQNIVVIDKSLKGTHLDEGKEVNEIYHRGLAASIVDFDPNYRDTQKDVALIKLGEKNLPALPLGSSEGLASGAKVSIFGFPYNAHMNNSDWFEPTLTEGVVGAIKDIKGQKVIQLDNKISHGSSGGPLIDQHGNVLGLVTYLTGANDQGDDFGFALPVELVKEVLAKRQIPNDLGIYGTSLLTGFYNQDNSYCKKALENFSTAGQINSHFPVSELLAKSVSACNELINTKMSKDSAWDMFRIYYQQHFANAMIFTALGLAALVLIGLLIWLGLKHLGHKKQNQGDMPNISMPTAA